MSSTISHLSNDQLLDVISYLDIDDFKSLRLAGDKSLCLFDPKLTSHLQLRMDRVPFFCDNNTNFSEHYMRQWLDNRHTLILNDAAGTARLCPRRIAYLVDNGYLDSITEIIIYDCHRYRVIVEILSRLPNVKSVMLVDSGDQAEAVDELENIISSVGCMSSLTSLDIDVDTVLHGSRLTFLDGLQGLKNLRLVGFDLGEGISNIRKLTSLETLQLTHGNFYSSPDDDVNEKDLTDLISLNQLQRLHLEGFDCMTGAGLGFATDSMQHLVMKHCQEASEECLIPISRMTNLQSLHFVLGSCDDIDFFGSESLERLNTLSELKSLSLMHVLEDASHLKLLPGLTSLETLNVAFDGTTSDEEAEELCDVALQVFPSLRKVRFFSEDGMERCCEHSGLDVEFSVFNFGDLLYLD